ncbi:MAG: hypothetical protein U0R64_10695 [Candidatus Nanopelagicales bacterium]
MALCPWPGRPCGGVFQGWGIVAPPSAGRRSRGSRKEATIVLILGEGSPVVLVFLPGFMTAGAAYRDLLAPVAAAGVECRVPQLYPRGPAALLGRHRVQDEAEAAAGIAAGLSGTGRPVWLAGHSRGGQASWRAAGLTAVQGLVLVDPVDGGGPGSAPTTTQRPPGFDLRPLIIGAGLGGRCAPQGLNHHAFAAAAPEAMHAVVADCGHGDMLGGRWRTFARVGCGGGSDPGAAREAISHLIRCWVTAPGDLPVDLPAGVQAVPRPE